MIPLDQVIDNLNTHGTVTVRWRQFADMHFPGRNGRAQAREWATKQGFVLIFIHSDDREPNAEPIYATFYRSMLRLSPES